jgi:hypothetical protein
LYFQNLVSSSHLIRTTNKQINSMKSKYAFLFSVLAIASATNASAITRVFNVTGATAFRAAANSTIITMLGGAGNTKYAFTGTAGISGTNRAIFEGEMPVQFPGDTIIVRASWSGSTQGILDLADGNSIQFLDDVGNTLTTAGQRLGEAGDPNPVYENAVARWAFSDVDKLLSTRPNAALSGGPVGVVPFQFLRGEGSINSLDNMTDQMHKLLWSTGFCKASILTGNAADAGKTVIATGRNNGSGTRSLILAETGYGAFTNVVQYNCTFQGTRTDAFPTGKLNAISAFAANSGHSSNSGVRDLLTRSSASFTLDGNAVDGFFVSYLTISDAIAAVTEGARALTYNGVAYSENAVRNGSYSLWGYQQLYMGNSPTTAETTFDTRLRALVPVDLIANAAGIPIPDMAVTRTGGDGGPIFPN